MGYIYLATLVLGLGTLVLQFVLSHVGGAEADGNADELHLDGGADGDADHDFDAGEHGELAHETPGAGSMALGIFFSMRFWTFALMAFGMVGTLLHYLQLTGFSVALALSLVSGIVSGFAAGFTFRMLKGTVSSSTGHDDTIGKLAKVTVAPRKGSLGKVRVEIKGNMVDLLAVTDAEEVRAGEEVVVVEFRGEHAYVEPIGRSDPKR